MENELKLAYFEKELDFIKDDSARDIAKTLLAQLPDYFYSVPASSTGKYHPAYTCGQGGLVRHTKAAIRIAESLMRLEMYEPITMFHDEIIIALLLHDGWKHGHPDEYGDYSQYCVAEHPELCANWLRSIAQQATVDELKHQLETIASLVQTHMGQWNENPRTGYQFATKPITAQQMFVHLCDFLASRKFLELVEDEYTL